jgi:hypothetical protein
MTWTEILLLHANVLDTHRRYQMDMSPACTAPVQPTATKADRDHTRFAEYSNWLSAMRRQLVSGNSFENWLRQTEESESLDRPHSSIFIYQGKHPAAGKWGRTEFGHKWRVVGTMGPFNSRAEAEAAGNPPAPAKKTTVSPYTPAEQAARRAHNLAAHADLAARFSAVHGTNHDNWPLAFAILGRQLFEAIEAQ